MLISGLQAKKYLENLASFSNKSILKINLFHRSMTHLEETSCYYVSIRRVQMPVRHLSWYQKVDNKDRFLELQQLQRSNILFLQPLRHTSFEATPPRRKTSGGALSRSSLLSAHLPNAITAAAFGWNLRFDNPFSWQHKREKSWKMAFGSTFLGWRVTLYERDSAFQRENMIKSLRTLYKSYLCTSKLSDTCISDKICPWYWRYGTNLCDISSI